MDTHPRFPMLVAVTRSYEIVFLGLPAFAHATRRWVLAGFAALMLERLFLRFHYLFLSADFYSDLLIARTASFYAAFGAFLLAISGAASAWHRAMLSEAAQDKGHSAVRGLIGVALRGLALLFALILPDVLVVVSGTGYLLTIFPLGDLLSIVAPVAIAGPAVGRFSLVLPAASIGDRAITFRAAWDVTRANSWRIFGGGLLVVAPPTILFVLLLRIMADALWQMYDVSTIATSVLITLGWTLIAGLGATYLSLAYRFFVLRQPTLEGNALDALTEHFK